MELLLERPSLMMDEAQYARILDTQDRLAGAIGDLRVTVAEKFTDLAGKVQALTSHVGHQNGRIAKNEGRTESLERAMERLADSRHVESQDRITEQRSTDEAKGRAFDRREELMDKIFKLLQQPRVVMALTVVSLAVIAAVYFAGGTLIALGHWK